MSILWTWPLLLHFRDHIPGLAGDNFSFLWNLWWMRKALSTPELQFFQSQYLFSPFGVDLINHPHTALQGYITATALAGVSLIQAENLYIIVSVFLNAACAYALAFDIVRDRRLAVLAGVAFGGSPYVAAHLFGHFDLLTAWVIPLFALFLRRALRTGSIAAALACGLCVAIAAYSAYYHVVYLALFALAYVVADVVRAAIEARSQTPKLFTIRLILVGLMGLVVFLIVTIAMTGGTTFAVGGTEISVRGVQNPLLALWLLALAWVLTKWRIAIRFERASGEAFWRTAQTLTIIVATFAVTCLPLIIQAFRLAASGRYVSQTYFWRSAPRGVDAIAPLLGNPFHPLYGGVTTGLYQQLGLDRIESVGWIGFVPLIVLMIGRGKWGDKEEARRWKFVVAMFALWALGPFLTVAGFDVGLPLPQALARFVPVVENARMPGRAMVCVYLALGVLMALRLACATGATEAGLKPCATGTESTGLKPCATDDGTPVPTAVAQDFSPASVVPVAQDFSAASVVPVAQGFSPVDATSVAQGFSAASVVPVAQGFSPASAVAQGFSPGYTWLLIALLALDYLHIPIPLTALDRPAVYEQLASIQDNGAVIEVPFGIGDGLSAGRGSQDRRLLYYATIHGHPVVGGYIGRMPPNVARGYESMPIVGNLLRLSSGEDAIDEDPPVALPFRYLVVDTATASTEMIEYMRHALDMDLIASGDGRQLYAVQGARPPSFRASR